MESPCSQNLAIGFIKETWPVQKKDWFCLLKLVGQASLYTQNHGQGVTLGGYIQVKLVKCGFSSTYLLIC